MANIDLETSLPRSSKDWHEVMNANFEKIESAINQIVNQQFDQSLNVEDDVTFNTVEASNLAIANWKLAYDQGVTGFELDGSTLTIRRRNASNLVANIAGAAGAIPSGLRVIEPMEFSWPGSGVAVPHDLGMQPWGFELWARLETSKGGWVSGDIVYMSSHFESGSSNWGMIVRADDSTFSLTSRGSPTLFLSNKDGSASRTSWDESEVTFILYMWAWDIPDE